MANSTHTVLTPDSADAREYNATRRWLGVADTAIGFAVLVVLLVTGWTADFRDISWHAAREHYALALFYYVALLALTAKLAGFAFEYYGFRLEHRFHLSNQKTGAWLFDELKGWMVGLVLGTVVAELIYWMIRNTSLWWVWSWLAFLLLFVLLAQLAPVLLLPLFYTFTPLEDEDLKRRLVALSERAGTRVRGVYEWKLSEKSKKANAALTGLGNTRRIILADTLLENYSHDEIEAVLAHELGHHVHGHIPKSIVVQAVVSFFGFWAANEVLRRFVEHSRHFNGIWDFADLPLLALVASALSLALLPAMNAYSRFNERQADHYCWKSIPDVGPFISAMTKLSEQNLSEKTPSRLVEVLFHSHPAIAKRVAAAEAWTAR